MRSIRVAVVVLVAVLGGLGSPSAIAGMPAPLTEDLQTILRLRESPHQRLQAISFFLVGIVASALAVKLLWNGLTRDWPRLPQLSFAKSLAIVALWGLMFLVVLTMISGARELMTPGAWKKDGATYSIRDEPADVSPREPDWTPKPFERNDSESQWPGSKP